MTYLYWHDELTTGKWHQIRQLRRGPRVDVVLAGSSQMLMALDPMTVVRPPRRAYNAAFYRAVPTVMTEWMTDVVLPAIRPRLVVWGVSILDLNDEGTFHRDIYARFNSAPARRTGAKARLGSWLRRHGLRPSPPGRPPAARAVDAPNQPLEKLLGPMGKGLEYIDFDTYRLSEEKRTFIQEHIVNEFTMGGRQIDALRRGAVLVRRAGARLILLEMPTTEEFHAMYPRGAADYAAAQQLIRDLAGELGVLFIEARADLPGNWFADCVHLNGVGMHGWSAELVDVVEDALS